MPLRRLLLLILGIICLLSIVLFSQSGVYAVDAHIEKPGSADDATDIGDWLIIYKSIFPIYVNRGEPAQFTIVVQNNSPVFAMKEVIVTDEQTSDCEKNIGQLPPKGETSYICVQDSVQEAFINTAIVSGKNATNNQTDSASDTARVEVLELLTNIEPEKSTIPSPGGAIKFTINLTNESSVFVTLDSLNSPQFGNLGDSQNGAVTNNNCPAIIDQTMGADGGSITCQFTTVVAGEPGDYLFEIDASGLADNVAPVSSSDSTEVEIVEFIDASLAADNEKYTIGTTAELTAIIKNLSVTNSVRILTLEDSVLGDLEPYGCGPGIIQPGGTYICSYEQIITAEVGEEQKFILNISAETDDIPPAPLSKQATTTILVIEPLLYLPITMNIQRPTSCETALRINANTSYQSVPDTFVEFYKLTLTEETNITVKVTNFVVSTDAGQIQVYHYTGNDCDSDTKELDLYDAGNNVNRTLGPKILPPDTYYVAVVNTGSLAVNQPYTLIVETQ